jgi:predicted ATPase/DNA-binding CsgD family transcriptional regulator/class 3 adenylate cyclase
MGLPTGTVTFLSTGIEASPREQERPEGTTRRLVDRSADVVTAAVVRYGGERLSDPGPGGELLAVFARAADGVAAAVDAQRSLAVEPWPDGAQLRVGMAVHTGVGVLSGDEVYGGAGVGRIAQVRALAHGGEVLVTHSTAEVVADDLPPGVGLRDLGEHRLRDLGRPERLHRLVGEALPHDFAPPRSLDAVRHNLPIPLTSFVGRTAELAELSRLRAANRLITLTGPGGAGKTRLALRAAAEATKEVDAAWWVDLATLTEPDAIDRALLAAVGAREEATRSPLDVLVEQFGGAPTVLVLDNCEHLVDAVAAFVDALLVRSASTSVLTTSREPLGVPGETVYRVPSLRLPVAGEGSGVAEADAVQLFVERARLVRPKFVLDGATRGPVVDICRRVDALPLAIELAAARTRLMSPAAIADALQDRFRVLGGGSRTLLARQQTLRASVDWSYDMLSPRERSVLSCLAVFVGSFSLSAAEAVAGTGEVDPYLVLDCLDTLVDKSLVQAEPEGDEPRYRLLETIRQYAAERLFDGGQVGPARDRHLAWCARLCAEAETGLDGPQLSQWVTRLTDERPNLTAAFDWAEERGDAERMWRMCGALTFWWASTGNFVDARRWFDACVAGDGDVAVPTQVPARWGATHLALFGGEFERGLTLGEQALGLARRLGDTKHTARSLNSVGMITMFDDRATGEEQLREAVALARQTGDLWCLADALQTLAILHLSRGDLAEAEVLYGESLPIARHLDNAQLLAWEYGARGLRNLRVGDFPGAVELLDGALRQAERTGDPNIVAWLTAWRAMCDMGMGRAASWVEPVDRALDRCRTVGAGQGLLALAAVSIPIRLAAGDVTGAEEAVHEWLPVLESEAPTLGSILGPYVVASSLAAGNRKEARRRAGCVGTCADVSASQIDAASVRLSTGVIDLLENEVAAAEAAAHEALPILASGPFAVELVDAFSLLGGVAAARGQTADAARLWGVADGHAERHGIAWTPLRAWASTCREDVRRAEDPTAFDAMAAAGAALPLGEALEWARRARGERGRPTSGWDALTPTELRVVELLVEGLSNPRIGERLFISAGTVKTHLAHVYAKLGLANRTEVASAFVQRTAGRDPSAP